MVRSGGEADKLGNRYEGVWAVSSILELLSGKVIAVEFEPQDRADSEGVESVCYLKDGAKSYLSAKRQNAKGAFSVSRLAARTPTQQNGVLGSFIAKLLRDPTATLTFVTQSAGPELIDLPVLAAATADLPDFIKRIQGRPIEAHFSQLTRQCENQADAAFSVLRRLRVLAKDQQSLIEDVERQILMAIESDGVMDPAAVRRLIADDLILGNLGRKIDLPFLRDFLAMHSLRQAATTATGAVLETSRRRTDQYKSRVESLLIDGTPIPRDEALRLHELIQAGAQRVFLEGPAGGGKSAVLSQLLNKLDESGSTCLAIRLDELSPGISTRQFGESWGLRESPIIALGRIAAGRPAVLILDQFDALSIASSRNANLWALVHELLDECQWVKNLTVVIACRSSDLEQDPRLRELASAGQPTRIALGALPEQTVKDVLLRISVAPESLSMPQIEMLRLPQNLYLFLNIDPSKRGGFRTVKELLDLYWDTKEAKVRTISGDPASEWSATIAELCDSLSQRERLSAPIEVLDHHPATRTAMLSESVLVRDGPRIAFFHESFFDYAFARGFVRQDKPLLEWLASEEQSLFRRSQVAQILEYRRDGDPDAYLRDVTDLLGDGSVRFHLKRRLMDWMQALYDPTQQEWQVIVAAADRGPAEWKSALLAIVRNSPPWFKVLLENGTWQAWLSPGEVRDIDWAVWLLATPDVMRVYGDDVAELLRPFVGRSAEWSNRLNYVMSRPQSYLGQGMQNLFLQLLDRGDLDDARPGFAINDDFWTLLYGASTANPAFCSKVIAHYLRRWVARYRENPTGSLFDVANVSQGSEHVIRESAKRAPEDYARELYAFVIGIMAECGDSIWPRISGRSDQWHVQILGALEEALCSLATSNPVLLDELLTSQPLTSRTSSYVALRAWSNNPAKYAASIARHLMEDPSRLEIEYQISYGDEISSIASAAVAASAPCLADELYRQLETAILDHTPERERAVDARDYRGATQYRLLAQLPMGRLTPQASRRLGELQRRFGRPTTAPGIRESMFGAIGSPVPEIALEYATDEQMIGAMRTYPIDRSSLRGGQIVGGALELSRTISAIAKHEPERCLTLCERMPDDLNSVYFDGLLDGLVESLPERPDEISADQRDRIWVVVRRLHDLAMHPCGRSILDAILKLSAGPIPPAILEITSWYAIHRADSEAVEQMQDRDDDTSSGHYELCHFSSVRENAAWAIAALIASHPETLDALTPALEALSGDPVPKVRATAAWAFKYAIRTDADRAIGWFLASMEDCERYWGASPVEDFLYSAIHWDYIQIRPFLLRMAATGDEQAVRVASRQICVASLSQDIAASDVATIRQGSEVQRQASAQVYAANAGAAGVSKDCQEFLAVFFQDESEKVREEAVRCFSSINPEELGKAHKLTSALIDSPAFLQGVEDLALRLEEAIQLSGSLVAEIALKAASELGPDAADLRTATSAKAYVLSNLVLRAYDQCHDKEDREKLLDAIDLMAEKGFLGLDRLDSVER